MKRRGFLVSSLAASALAGTNPSAEGSTAQGGQGAANREIYELRKYLLRRGPQPQRVIDYFRDAAIPALNRLGVKSVGVFNTTIGPGSPTIYVLAPFPSLESAISIPARLVADPEYRRAGAAFNDASPTDPAYLRMDSFLLAAFAGMPNLELPAGAASGQPRIFELRTYESHSKKASRTKIEMFNRAEIAIFRRTGLHPVFFGETLMGAGQPSLTYMLTFADMAERTSSWAAFGADPEWKKLSSTPGYTDAEIVSNITNVILSPAPCSQI